MIALIKSYILWVRGLIIDWLYDQLELQNLERQQQQLTYLSQRVHALNKPIVLSQNNSFHYPTLDELTYEYKLFKQNVTIFPSRETISLEIVGHGLKTDYRYVGQANHRLYMKIVNSTKESVWYNCCETVQVIGLVEKDGCYNVRHDKKYKSTPYQRACFVPSTIINGECTVFLRFGKLKDSNIICEQIKVT